MTCLLISKVVPRETDGQLHQDHYQHVIGCSWGHQRELTYSPKSRNICLHKRKKKRERERVKKHHLFVTHSLTRSLSCFLLHQWTVRHKQLSQRSPVAKKNPQTPRTKATPPQRNTPQTRLSPARTVGMTNGNTATKRPLWSQRRCVGRN